MQSQIKILYVDEQIGLCQSLALVLESKQKNLRVYTANDFENALKIVNSNLDISIALITLKLNEKNGLRLIPFLRKLIPDINILIFSMFSDPLHIEQALQFDIDGYISKACTIDEILRAIITVHNGGTYYCREVRSVMNVLFNNLTKVPEGVYKNCFLYTKSLQKKNKKFFSF